MAEQDVETAARRQTSIDALDRGGLPTAATERLDEIRRGDGGWTSDLSVAELVAVRHAGFEPVGMVMGSAVMRIAAQWGYAVGFAGAPGQNVETFPCPWNYYGGAEHVNGYNWEHTTHEGGVTSARDLALNRMVEEARVLGAHGVVGAEVTMRHLEGVGHSMEFTVIGTAIRRTGAPPVPQPFMSHLKGQQFGKLLHAGYVPVALVIGVGAVEIDPGCGMESSHIGWSNVEVGQLSRGVAMARDLSIGHLEREVVHFDADGAVGVDMRFSLHDLPGSREPKLAEMFCIGTAVRHFSHEQPDAVPIAIMRLR